MEVYEYQIYLKITWQYSHKRLQNSLTWVCTKNTETVIKAPKFGGKNFEGLQSLSFSEVNYLKQVAVMYV